MSQSALAAWQCFQIAQNVYIETWKLYTNLLLCGSILLFYGLSVWRSMWNCWLQMNCWHTITLAGWFFFISILPGMLSSRRFYPCQESNFQDQNHLDSSVCTVRTGFAIVRLAQLVECWGGGIHTHSRNNPESINKKAAKTTHIWNFYHNEGSLSLYWQFL